MLLIKVIISSLFFIHISFFVGAQVLTLADTGRCADSVIPEGWDMLSFSSGDLNKNGLSDFPIVVKGLDPKNYEFIENGAGQDTLDMNPKVLAVYFGQDDGTYKKTLQSNTFIIPRENLSMDEPFDRVKILPTGVLQIDFHLWYSMGSWYMSNHTYTFRYQNRHFELIGYDSSTTHRASGETTDNSINFSTRKMRIIHLSYDEDTDDEIKIEKWESFELPKLKSIDSLKMPFNWVFGDLNI